MFCHSCGKNVVQGNAFCSHCGAKVSIQTTDYGQSNKPIDPYNAPSGKLALTFGLLGLLGIVSCGLLSFFAIPAWIIGAKDRKNYPHDERLKAAKVMGIIGVIILAISMIASFIVIAVYLQDFLKSYMSRFMQR